MATIHISMAGEWAGQGRLRWTDGEARIEDCPAVLPDGAYEAIEADITRRVLERAHCGAPALPSGEEGGIVYAGHTYYWRVEGAAVARLRGDTHNAM